MYAQTQAGPSGIARAEKTSNSIHNLSTQAEEGVYYLINRLRDVNERLDGPAKPVSTAEARPSMPIPHTLDAAVEGIKMAHSLLTSIENKLF